MKLHALAVYDSKAEAFLPPFFVVAIGQGIRQFGDACKDDNSGIGKHYDDYRLFKVGEFDDSTGGISEGGNLAPVLLCTGVEARNAG